MYEATPSEEFVRRYIDNKHRYILLQHKSGKLIVADIECSASFYAYSTWIFLRQSDYNLFCSDRNRFNDWIAQIRSKGRDGDSEFLIRYDKATEKSYTLSEPEEINNVRTEMFQSKT